MLVRLIVSLFIIMTADQVFAQDHDSLYVIPNGKGWMSVYVVKKPVSLFLLAHHFHVPPAIFADVNGLNAKVSFNVNAVVVIPMGTFNLSKKMPPPEAPFRPVYHRVSSSDALSQISNCTGVADTTIAAWNNLHKNAIHEGQILLVGWVQYDENDVTSPSLPKANLKPVKGVQIIPVPFVIDTSGHKLTELEKIYLKQTDNEAHITTEKGPASFFDNGTHGNTTFYAFHNLIPRGTIIKVFNPGDDKTIYVKVIGPLPDTKQFYNSIIGISGNAKEALGVFDIKAWCELSFSNQ